MVGVRRIQRDDRSAECCLRRSGGPPILEDASARGAANDYCRSIGDGSPVRDVLRSALGWGNGCKAQSESLVYRKLVLFPLGAGNSLRTLVGRDHLLSRA